MPLPISSLTYVLSLAEMGSADLLQSEDTPHTLVAGNVDNSVEEGIILCSR